MSGHYNIRRGNHFDEEIHQTFEMRCLSKTATFIQKLLNTFQNKGMVVLYTVHHNHLEFK